MDRRSAQNHFRYFNIGRRRFSVLGKNDCVDISVVIDRYMTRPSVVRRKLGGFATNNIRLVKTREETLMELTVNQCRSAVGFAGSHGAKLITAVSQSEAA